MSYVPPCRCTAHPSGDDKKKYMVVVEETQDHVVFCCKRCTEIERVAVIQVVTLPRGKAAAAYEVSQQRRSMDPQLLRMLQRRKRGGITVREEHNA